MSAKQQDEMRLWAADDARAGRVAERCGYASSERYLARAAFLFDGLNLEARRVLDIGCGRGAWALWAGLRGAAYVLGIEPESAGSSAGVLRQFQATIDHTGLSNVEARAAALEELHAEGDFDIIIAYNVVNHFSESHTRTLSAPESRRFYIETFRHISHLLRPGGVFILADCSNRNLWSDLRLPNPLVPSIEWDVHQPPQAWSAIAHEVGLQTIDLRWSYFYPFTQVRVPSWAAYLLTSHFVLRLRRQPAIERM